MLVVGSQELYFEIAAMERHVIIVICRRQLDLRLFRLGKLRQ